MWMSGDIGLSGLDGRSRCTAGRMMVAHVWSVAAIVRHMMRMMSVARRGEWCW